MIVAPEFQEHWKTRLLVEITKDESAPLAVLRGWAFCQTSRRWRFPGMTGAQLAAVCRWGNRKPAAHLALVKAGFVDRLKKGFAFHDWQDANAQLIQKWRAGAKGGRIKKKCTGEKPPQTGRSHPVSRKETGGKPTRQVKIKTGFEEKHQHNVNVVNHHAEHDLTNLTLATVALERVAREIADNKRGWCYDNCKVRAEEIKARSLQKVLRPYSGRLTEDSIHECWQEAVKRTHAATVDGLAKQPAAYVVACFKEQLQTAITTP